MCFTAPSLSLLKKCSKPHSPPHSIHLINPLDTHLKMRFLWAAWAVPALAVFNDQAYKVDWQYRGLGIPFEAVKTAAGHVMLTDRDQLALVDNNGVLVWRKTVLAQHIAVGNNTVYSSSNTEVTAWQLDSGDRLTSVPGGSLVCANNAAFAVAKDSKVFIYEHGSKEPQQVEFGGTLDALKCVDGVVGWVGNDPKKVVNGDLESVEDSKPVFGLGDITVDEFGVVSAPEWSRPEGLSQTVAACFLEIEHAVDAKLPDLSGTLLENWSGRVKRHVKELMRFRISTQVNEKDALFGYHKALILVTSRGSVYAFDTNSRSILWEKHVGAVSVENFENLAVVTLSNGFKIAFSHEGTEQAVPETPKPEFDLDIQPSYVAGLANGSESWRFSGNVVGTARRDPREVTSNVGTVVGDAKVRYKYLNPNLVAVATYENNRLVVTLLDGITGRTLAVSEVEDSVTIDAQNKFLIVVGEHWVAFTYRSKDELASSKLSILDLYESSVLNERLSPDQVNPYTDSQIPWIFQRVVVLKSPLQALGTSVTHFGVTRREVLMATDTQVLSVPKLGLSALRVSPEKGKPVQEPDTVLTAPDSSVISHERIVHGITRFTTATTLLESTFALCAYGDLDVFYTRVSPSGEFDRLPETFQTTKLLAIIASLGALVMFLRPIARNKRIQQEWI